MINYATVSNDGLCIPMSENVFLPNPGKKDTIYLFQSFILIYILINLAVITSMTTTDYVPRIDDPSIFDIPAECHTIV